MPLLRRGIGRIALGEKPEFATADEKGKVYVNLEETSEVVEIHSQEVGGNEAVPA
jgi:hypothetical protein